MQSTHRPFARKRSVIMLASSISDKMKRQTGRQQAKPNHGAVARAHGFEAWQHHANQARHDEQRAKQAHGNLGCNGVVADQRYIGAGGRTRDGVELAQLSGGRIYGRDAAMFDRVRNFVMTALFGGWTEYAANKSFRAVDGAVIAPCEWHWRRWDGDGWHHLRMPAEVQREIAWDSAVK